MNTVELAKQVKIAWHVVMSVERSGGITPEQADTLHEAIDGVYDSLVTELEVVASGTKRRKYLSK